ncbi:hypothetical protein AshY1_00700 [Candidatus Phytoplasma fraxini]|uniref:Uncharacterized protein n=1 Tax=Ash yellows phytoplasma TaxID=35780 RepID=A0ABZ2U7K4_ASHYP
MLNNMFKRDEDYKKLLEKRNKGAEIQYKDVIIFDLNSLYEITSNEG